MFRGPGGWYLFYLGTSMLRSRQNFDRFDNALLTSFIMQTCSDWNEIMYEGIQSVGGSEGASAIAGMYFIGVVAFGHYILFGVLLAIAYKNLDDVIAEEKPRRLSQLDIRSGTYQIDAKKQQPPILNESALFCLSPANRFRVWCHGLVHHVWFDRTILVCIVSGSILLGVEDFTNPDNPRNDTLFIFDAIFTAIFVVEMAVKVISMGFVLHTKAYLRKGWNILDFTIVVSSLISLGYHGAPAAASNVGFVKVIRALRVLRPLRTVSRAPHLKRVVEAMIKSVKNIWGLLTVAFVILFCTEGPNL